MHPFHLHLRPNLKGVAAICNCGQCNSFTTLILGFIGVLRYATVACADCQFVTYAIASWLELKQDNANKLRIDPAATIILNGERVLCLTI